MLINELSKRTGISTHTIRFYEKSGLIKGTRDENITSNRYFHYGEETIEKLELVRDAKAVGFTINEIGKLMDAWYSNKITVDEKLSILDKKLVSIDDKITQLQNMKLLISEYKKDVESEYC